MSILNFSGSKNKKLYKYIIVMLIFLFVFIFLMAAITYFFPLRTYSTNLAKPKFSPFVAAWPMSAIDLEFQERKRLKRYAKAEKKRRLEKQLQKMNVLNVPVYDMLYAGVVGFLYCLVRLEQQVLCGGFLSPPR